jgi:hypothetical protein
MNVFALAEFVLPSGFQPLICSLAFATRTALSHCVQFVLFRIDLQIDLSLFGGTRTVAEYTNGSWNDALLGIVAFASMGVRVSNDFDTIHCRSQCAFLKVA